MRHKHKARIVEQHEQEIARLYNKCDASCISLTQNRRAAPPMQCRLSKAAAIRRRLKLRNCWVRAEARARDDDSARFPAAPLGRRFSSLSCEPVCRAYCL